MDKELSKRAVFHMPTVIMDNAGFHGKAKLRKLAEKAGGWLPFLPAYSHDLNPTEKTWRT